MRCGWRERRRVKKSEMILRWMITPEMQSAIIAMPARPVSHVPRFQILRCSV